MSLKRPIKHAVLTCNATSVLETLVGSMKDLEFSNLCAYERTSKGVNSVEVTALITRTKGNRPVTQNSFVRKFPNQLMQRGNVSGVIDGVQVIINDQQAVKKDGSTDWNKVVGVTVRLIAVDNKAHSEQAFAQTESYNVAEAKKLLKKHGYRIEKVA